MQDSRETKMINFIRSNNDHNINNINLLQLIENIAEQATDGVSCNRTTHVNLIFQLTQIDTLASVIAEALGRQDIKLQMATAEPLKQTKKTAK